MNSQRNRSKAGRKKGWPYDNIGGTSAEKRKAHADRIAATKKNSKKKLIRAKFAPPKETLALKATRVTRAKAAARKVFETWLASAAVENFAQFCSDASALRRCVEGALHDCLPETWT